MIRLLLAAGLCVILSACVSSDFQSVDDWLKTYNARGEIKIHRSGVSRQYTALGRVETELQKGAPQYGGHRGIGDVIGILRRQAAELGADAIIHFKFSEERASAFSWGSISGSGTAIKYN